MRKTFVLLWLLCPVAVLTYHFNYGQAELAREQARERLVYIRELEQAKEPDWELILAEYDKVAAQLPPNDHPRARHQVRLAKAKARLEMLDVAGALTDLTQLLAESAAASGEDAPTTRAIRETQGKAFYYATSLLRASGATEDECVWARGPASAGFLRRRGLRAASLTGAETASTGLATAGRSPCGRSPRGLSDRGRSLRGLSPRGPSGSNHELAMIPLRAGRVPVSRVEWPGQVSVAACD